MSDSIIMNPQPPHVSHGFIGVPGHPGLVGTPRAPDPAHCPDYLQGDQVLIWNFFEEAKCICIKKNIDYGSSVFEPPAVAPHLDCSSAILVRMSDKIKRIQSLLKSGHNLVKNESIDDTMMDLGVYAFLYVISKKRNCAKAKEKA